MATLTGFKRVGDQKQAAGAKGQSASDAQQPQENGEHNPVFEFDEVDGIAQLGQSNSKSNQHSANASVAANEEFVDASSNIVAGNNAQSKSQDSAKQQHTTQQQQQVNGDVSATPVVVIKISDPASGPPSLDATVASSDEQAADVVAPQQQQQESSKSAEQEQQQSTPQPPMTPPGEPKHQNMPSKMSASTGKPIESPVDVPPQQQQQESQKQQKQQQPPARQQRSIGNSLAPNNCPNGDDNADAASVSMLAIDCAGTGKSPRQPRRSPLMALFRGKPRESVRRLYTDEDQFEIEWANLSLEVQSKWYQRINTSAIWSRITGGNSGGERKYDLEDGKDVDGAKSTQQQQTKRILSHVDGRIRSGEITAVLGPSGAGKTSLLNSLFGKYRTAVSGSIRVTGAPSKKHLTVCTIPQSDYLIGYLTTEEALWFASRLKNTEDDFNHDRNIERVIELLGLQRCRHTRINKLSGGQYKRVSIAQEMLSSPDILVLDEPTSGLDSLTCYRTVKVLRDLVEASKAHNLVNPMSIILTIHQPHTEVLELFHSVYVMAVGGMTLYQGPPREMDECINKFSGTQMPAHGYNPASFMVEIASEEYGRKPIDALVTRQREKFRATTKHRYPYDFSVIGDEAAQQSLLAGSAEPGAASKGNKKNNKATDSMVSLYPLSKANSTSTFVDVDLSTSQRGAQNANKQLAVAGKDIDSRIMTPRSGKNSDGVFWRHVNLMSKRCFLSNNRDPLLCTIRVGAHIFIPLVVAFIYGPKMGIPNGCPFYQPEINLLEYASLGVEEIQEKHDDIRIQFQNVGLHFMVYYAFGLCMLAFTAISFPLIMHVLIKEIRNGWYSLSTFIVGKMLAELPMATILPPISVAIIYWMTGQPSSYLEWRYMVQSLLLILIIMIAEAKGLIFGAICMNSMQTAVFAASVSTVPFILLSGFLIRIHEVPYVLQHFAKFSYFKHSVEALIITRYGFGMCPCDPALIPANGVPRIIGIPPQIMSLTDYYVNAYVPTPDNSSATLDGDSSALTTETNIPGNTRNIDTIMNAITTLAPELDDANEEPRLAIMAAAAANGAANAASAAAADDTSTTSNNRGARNARQASRNPKRKTTTTSTTTTTTTTAAPEEEEEETEPPVRQGVFFDKLASLLTRANAFGYSINSCEDVQPFTMKDMKLKDWMLPPIIGYMFLYIFVLKLISYFIVEICVKLKL